MSEIKVIAGSRVDSASTARPSRPRRRQIPFMRAGLLLLTLGWLASCSQSPVIQPPQTILLRPSAHLMAPTAIPDYHGATNGDLLTGIKECRAAISQCNADKAAIDAETAQTDTKKPAPAPKRTGPAAVLREFMGGVFGR